MDSRHSLVEIRLNTIVFLLSFFKPNEPSPSVIPAKNSGYNSALIFGKINLSLLLTGIYLLNLFVFFDWKRFDQMVFTIISQDIEELIDRDCLGQR